jgi:hypothetical protein
MSVIRFAITYLLHYFQHFQEVTLLWWLWFLFPISMDTTKMKYFQTIRIHITHLWCFWDRVGYDFFISCWTNWFSDATFFSVSICSTFCCHRIAKFIILIFVRKCVKIILISVKGIHSQNCQNNFVTTKNFH